MIDVISDSEPGEEEDLLLHQVETRSNVVSGSTVCFAVVIYSPH